MGRTSDEKSGTCTLKVRLEGGSLEQAESKRVTFCMRDLKVKASTCLLLEALL